MTFPHTNGGEIERDIPCVLDRDFVEALNISNGFVQKIDASNPYKFSFTTENSTTQVTYEVFYNLRKAVRVYDDSCDDDTSNPDHEKKVIRWKSPQAWSPSVDIEKGKIILSTDDQNETISDEISDGGEYYHVFEWDCPAESLQCCPSRQSTRTLTITFIVIIAVIVIILVLFCWARRRRSSPSNVDS